METISYPKLTKAIKQHKCDFCRQPIEKGINYFKSTHVDGGIYDWRTHEDCSYIAEKLKMYDNADDGVSESFFMEEIKDEYSRIMSETQNEVYESESFVIPLFKEQLQLVINFHRASWKNYLLKPS